MRIEKNNFSFDFGYGGIVCMICGGQVASSVLTSQCLSLLITTPLLLDFIENNDENRSWRRLLAEGGDSFVNQVHRRRFAEPNRSDFMNFSAIQGRWLGGSYYQNPESAPVHSMQWIFLGNRDLNFQRSSREMNPATTASLYSWRTGTVQYPNMY
ncbi:hypothetical protein AVEN_208089-1 [Araneus ventricosus]|uniref:Uncharacterized protein n=1 Tax=Araneus ventricosus TaxID=182803 RepID=A0A4Y2FWB8_ARAVE|nr:hypothetical protein AVEN_208089-1 [Araneus ventricosus]